MTSYRFLARDWHTGTLLGTLPFSRFQFTDTLCRAGTWDAEMDPYDPAAALLVPKRTYVYAMRDDGTIAFAGMLGALDWSAQSEGVDTLTASGFSLWGYFARRLIGQDYSFGLIDQLAIAKILLDDAQSVVPYPQGSIGMATVLHPAAGSGVLRDRTTWLATDGKPIAEAVEQLADVANGFEFAVSAAFTTPPGGAARTIVHTCDIWYPRLGADLSFVWRDGTGIRVTDFGDDFSNYANSALAVGTVAGTGTIPPVARVAYTGPASEPIYEVALSATSVTDPNTLADTATHAMQTSELYVISAELVDDTNYAYGSAWNVGDTVRIVSERGSLHLTGDIFWRITQAQVQIDDIGAVTTTLTLTDSGRRSRPALPPAQRLAAIRARQAQAVAALQRHP
jgi:hypothetical protein